MTQKTRNILIPLLVLVLAAGVVLYWNRTSKQPAPTPSPDKPLTLEEAKIAIINASSWKTYKSGDGVLEMRYPDRIEQATEIDVKAKDYWGLPGTTHHIDLRGKYLPEELAKRAGTENEAGMSVTVLLYNKSQKQDYILGMERKMTDMPSATSSVMIGGHTYEKVSYKGTGGSESGVKSYIRTLPDGRVLHIRERADAGDETVAEVNWTLADRTVSEIIASIEVK